MNAGLVQAVRKDGFVFLPKYMPEVSTEVALRSFSSISTPAGFDDIQILRPRHVHEFPPNTYSGNYGYGAFPFHTDLAHWYLPPRYVALRCISGSSAVTTDLTCGYALVQEFGAANMRRVLLLPRRPMRGIRVLLRLLESSGDGLNRLRWDTLYLLPATKLSAGICETIQAFLSTPPITSIALSVPGDTLVIDNWRMLHARSPVPDACVERVIHRAYLGVLL